MKRTIVALVVVMIFAIGLSVFAQETAEKPKARAAGQGILKDLGLNKEQMRKIMGIVKQFRTDAKAIVQAEVPKDEKKTKLQTLKEKAASDINAVLDTTQQEKAKEAGLIDRLLGAKKERAMKMQMVLKQLNLNDAQKEVVKGIFQNSKDQAQVIKDDKSLTDEVRKTQLAQLQSDTLRRIRAALDPEQQKKLDELMAQSPKKGKPDKQK